MSRTGQTYSAVCFVVNWTKLIVCDAYGVGFMTELMARAWLPSEESTHAMRDFPGVWDFLWSSSSFYKVFQRLQPTATL